MVRTLREGIYRDRSTCFHQHSYTDQSCYRSSCLRICMIAHTPRRKTPTSTELRSDLPSNRAGTGRTGSFPDTTRRSNSYSSAVARLHCHMTQSCDRTLLYSGISIYTLDRTGSLDSGPCNWGNQCIRTCPLSDRTWRPVRSDISACSPGRRCCCSSLCMTSDIVLRPSPACRCRFGCSGSIRRRFGTGKLWDMFRWGNAGRNKTRTSPSPALGKPLRHCIFETYDVN